MSEERTLYDLRGIPDRPKDFLASDSEEDMSLLFKIMDHLTAAGREVFLIQARDKTLPVSGVAYASKPVGARKG